MEGGARNSDYNITKMKVLLLQNVKNVGQKGKEIEVSDGYARNFLIPQGLAVDVKGSAGKQVLRKLEKSQKQLEQKKTEQFEIIHKLKGEKYIVKRQATEKGSLFASVTTEDMAKIIGSHLHLRVDPSKIKINDPIKSLGEHTATYVVSETEAQFNIVVKPKNNK